MPKVRDLGISFIPATMRPLEFGDGAAGIPPCDPSGVCRPPSCAEPSFDDCEDRSCRGRSYGDCDPSGCQKGASCVEPSSDDDKDKDKDKTDKYERSLSAAAIAQLKQQMQEQLGA